MTVQKKWILAGAAMGFLGVALGAFGAHGLKPVLAPEMLDICSLSINTLCCNACNCIKR